MPDTTPFELVLSRDTWEGALRHLLVRPDRVAVGRCRRNEHEGAHELLVENLEIADRLPSGNERPPLSDWIVLGVPTGEPGDDVRTWVKHLQPRKTQLLVIALLGLGPEKNSWDGGVVEDGVLKPLDAIRVVGPAMLRASRTEPAGWSELSETDLERWSRTRGALGDKTWRKVAGTRVLLFGAGRNGSAMAFQLVALGARSLTIVDPDIVGIENLDAAYGLSESDIGRRKVEALQERLHSFRSSCAISSIPHSVTHSSVIAKARGADLLVSCVDHDTPRLAAALLANRFFKLHVDVGTGITLDPTGERMLASDVRLLLPRMGCVCCVGGLSNEEEARYELLAAPGTLRRKRQHEWHEERAGSLVTLNSMTVSVAVQLWLDLLAGKLRTSFWHRLRWEPAGGIRADFAAVGPAADCHICRGQSTLH
jgi:hypothetical protein